MCWFGWCLAGWLAGYTTHRSKRKKRLWLAGSACTLWAFAAASKGGAKKEVYGDKNPPVSQTPSPSHVSGSVGVN
jgi:hypothetical protein